MPIRNYINYFEMIVPKMNKGGVILSDNVLWSGKVLEPLNPKDISTKVLLDYNNLLINDPRVETVLLPIRRDGLTVSRVSGLNSNSLICVAYMRI
jgi:predicted O-methyltransferase YrrM